MKRLPTEWEEIFANDTSDKGLISKLCKEIIQLNIKKSDLKMDKGPEEIFLQRRRKNGHRHMRRCSTSLIIREMQIKTTMAYHLTLIRMAIIKKTTNNKCW